MIDAKLLSRITEGVASCFCYRLRLRRPAILTIPYAAVLDRMTGRYGEEVIKHKIAQAMTSRSDRSFRGDCSEMIEDQVELLVMTRDEFDYAVRTAVERYETQRPLKD